MRTRPTTATAAAALTAAVTLLLSGCGGSDSEDSGKDKIAGADTGASASASPTPSPSDDGIERPEVRLPQGVKDVFEDGETGDEEKDAVLADHERNMTAIDAAITGDQAAAQPAVKFYNKDAALLSAAEYIQSFYDNDRSFVGTTRYYKREVTLLKDGAAALTYCIDGTKTYPKDRKTGKVDKSIPASADDYTFVTERLEKNDQGVWQSAKVTSGAGAEKCM
ncbi:hypothetical protein [Streptomyces sp. ZSW22]|uniref:hypothetical protein n=1 Tax=Streptomyces sp. ZSW22 TaxID=3055050 RepID=UPI0025B10B71|nr:hypothetical protein [Streptomyces sp. ZSW22]MDN3246209.1 hypothetical protein [Streptomyces sp. ZSW22]